MTTKSIKTILTEFESYNNSSIQPLPPIAKKCTDQSGPHWSVVEQTKKQTKQKPNNTLVKSQVNRSQFFCKFRLIGNASNRQKSEQIFSKNRRQTRNTKDLK